MRINKFILVFTIASIFIITGCEEKNVNIGINSNDAMKIAENILPDYSEINKIFNGYIETKGEVIMDENNNAYMEANDEKYKCIDDIKELLESVFTTEYIDKKYNKIFESEYPYFKEIKDNLYVSVNSGMIKPLSEDPIEKIELLENNLFSAVVIFGGDGSQTIKSTFYFKKVNNNWLIDEIEN